MGKLDSKVAIVTGGGTGIGRSAAIAFSREGAKVVICGRRKEPLREVVDFIYSQKGEAKFIEADISNSVDVRNVVKFVVDTFGKLDILYNNAATFEKCMPTAEVEEDAFNRIINTNLRGVWLGMKYAIPEMVKGGKGSIINSTSHVAYQPELGAAIYCASKAAVIQLTRVTALEYAHRNIRVNWIAPGFVETPMVEASMEGNVDALGQLAKELPLGRFGQPNELDSATLFFASDESAYVTGTGIVADGGISLAGCPLLVKKWW